MDLRLPPSLDRRFEAVVFDWDGTAVPDRGADAGELRGLVEELSTLGLDLIVITGTHVGNVDGQLGARPVGPGRLYFCVNRGSEVYAASPKGVELVDRREATQAEEAALDAAAAETVAELGRRGVTAAVVSQRLNRRKIDLIPEPEWADPPKARIGELLAAVQARLRGAGFDGLGDAVEVALAAATLCGAGRSPRDERREARRDRADRQGRRRPVGVRGAGAQRDRPRPRSDRGRRVRTARAA